MKYTTRSGMGMNRALLMMDQLSGSLGSKTVLTIDTAQSYRCLLRQVNKTSRASGSYAFLLGSDANTDFISPGLIILNDSWRKRNSYLNPFSDQSLVADILRKSRR